MSAEAAVTPLAVAGIPFVHEAEENIPAPRFITPGWPGTVVTDDPIRVRHMVGSTDPAGLIPLMTGLPPLGVYYMDASRNLAIRSRGMEHAGDLAQLLRTRRGGFEYAISYETAADAPRLQWGWHRTIFMFALPLRRKGLLVHAAGFVLPTGVAVVCPGVSGAGKSTLAQTLVRDDGPRVQVLGDDRIAVTLEGSALRAWGTPWHSSAGTAAALDAPAGAIVFVRHGRDASLAPLPARAVVPRLLRTVAIPFWDRSATEFALDVVERIVTTMPAFEFTYSPVPGAGRVLTDSLLDALRATG
jgi:hypothetical protein